MVSSMINADILPSFSKVNILRIKLLYPIPDCDMNDFFLFLQMVPVLRGIFKTQSYEIQV